MFHTKPRYLMIIACGIFLVFGMFNAAIGPVLGELAEQTSSTLAAVGSIFTFLFLGSLVAQLISGPLTDRFGQRPLLLASLLLVAVSLPGFTTARSLPVMLTLVFFTGMGQGGLDLEANLVVSAAYPKNTTPMLNLLHFFFGLGAFLGPAAVSLAMVATGSGMIIHWIAAGIFLVLAVIVFTLREEKPQRQQVADPLADAPKEGERIYLSPLLWLICILILFYVGVEYGTGSWSTRFMAVTTQMAVENGALVTSAYWGALTIGRLGGAALSSRVSRTRLLTMAVLGSLVGSIALTMSRGAVVPSIIAIVLMGLSFGTIYPTSVAVMVTAFPADQGKAVGLLTAMGSIGGLSLPWLGGILLENVSPLAFTLFLNIGIVIMLVLLLTLGQLSKRENQP